MADFPKPSNGTPITFENGEINVPDNPIIPFIEGDGIGPDIWAAAQKVIDAAVEKAYGGKKSIAWYEIFAGQKAFDTFGEWLPEGTTDALKKYFIGIKGPLTTPIGGGFRSLNVALRQILDLYVCLRPVRHFAGVPSPVKHPENVNMVIFRENTEDIYAGIEWEAGSKEANRIIEVCKELGVTYPFLENTGIGIKPVSVVRSKRLIRAAIQYAIDNNLPSVTLVHKGNIMKFTEGSFKQWGYDLVKEEFADKAVSWDDCNGEPGDKILVKDSIADITLQQVLTRPKEFSVIATLNLNGDYLSDALAAQVGGIGIAPGGNISYATGHALFEATHGTAPKYANQDKVNPGSVILSAEMMLRHLGWLEAADLILAGINGAIGAKTVTYDFERLMEGATLLKCSEFGDAIITNM